MAKTLLWHKIDWNSRQTFNDSIWYFCSRGKTVKKPLTSLKQQPSMQNQPVNPPHPSLCPTDAMIRWKTANVIWCEVQKELNLVVFRRPRAQPPGPPPRPPPPPVRVRRQASPPRGRPRAPQTLSGMGPPLPAPRWLGPTFPPPVPSPKLWYLAAPTARLRPKKSMHVQVLPSVESWWVHTSYIKTEPWFQTKVTGEYLHHKRVLLNFWDDSLRAEILASLNENSKS